MFATLATSDICEAWEEEGVVYDILFPFPCATMIELRVFSPPVERRLVVVNKR